MRPGLCIVLLAGLLGAPALHADTLKAGVFSPARMAPAFTLDGSDGQPLTLERFRGEVVLLGFGFTSCREVCPVTLTTLAAAFRQLGERASEVQLVYISVDPERDSPERLHQYLSAFNPDFLGGTGTPGQLAAVRKEYGIMAERKAGPDGDYSHSSFIYLIDREGRLHALMPYGHAPADFVHDLKILLAAP